MKYLLDTGVFIWSIGPKEKLNQEAHELLANGSEEIYFSAASSWEIAIKFALGKLRLPEVPERFVPQQMAIGQIRQLPITHYHALAVRKLPSHHNDPFDRILIAQARAEEMILLTADLMFSKYDVETIWCGK
ncbi:MAG TPA: type II toxin-antitoxin system VapC family toxin [Candidatus Angelobacter sp.]|nr:type II toxin-antitoxin system VapC family toxin [Candidatus Angelobacter sp.]